jgi:hypothetical protein
MGRHSDHIAEEKEATCRGFASVPASDTMLDRKLVPAAAARMAPDVCHTPPKGGVVAASGRNHGAAFAYVARSMGITARSSSPLARVRLRSLGSPVTGPVWYELVTAMPRH